MTRRALRNGASTWPAKAVDWPIATNAGPFLPEMFPYGVGGVRQDYALKNTSQSTTFKDVAAFKAAFPNQSANIMSVRVGTAKYPNIFAVMGSGSNTSYSPSSNYVLTAWHESEGEKGYFPYGVGLGVSVLYRDAHVFQRDATTLLNEMRRGKLIWLDGSVFDVPSMGHANLIVKSTCIPIKWERDIYNDKPDFRGYVHAQIQQMEKSNQFRVIWYVVGTANNLLGKPHEFSSGSKRRFDTWETARNYVEAELGL